MQETQVQPLGQEDPLEEEMATHSNILLGEFHAQKGLTGYCPMGLQRVKHDWATNTHFHLPLTTPMT